VWATQGLESGSPVYGVGGARQGAANSGGYAGTKGMIFIQENIGS